jgi:HEAT repeat protein
LGRIGDPKGVAALRERLADPNGLVRAAAAGALAKLQPEGAEVDLAPLLDDPNGAVRLAAAQALQRLRGHNTGSSP